MSDSESCFEMSENVEYFSSSKQKMHKDTFKGSLLGCSENVPNTVLTAVWTINVSIDCNGV